MLQVKKKTCEMCGGSGWVTSQGDLRARECSCQHDAKKSRRVASAGIPKRYIHCTLANFNDQGNVSLSSAKRRITEFSSNWPGADRGLLLMGGCGTGKTHLAVSVLEEIIRNEKPGKLLFATFQDLLEHIQASFGSDEVQTKSEILKPVLEADLLILDELGSQKPTPFVQDVLYYIINTRYNEERATIFTTNYLDEPREKSEEPLQFRIGERLRSRLHEMTERVLLDSKDYRKNVSGRRV